MEVGMLEAVLQSLYDSEIDIRISWLWDGGFTVAVLDASTSPDPLEMVALDEATVGTAAEIAPFLIEAACRLFPHSAFNWWVLHRE